MTLQCYCGVWHHGESLRDDFGFSLCVECPPTHWQIHNVLCSKRSHKVMKISQTLSLFSHYHLFKKRRWRSWWFAGPSFGLYFLMLLNNIRLCAKAVTTIFYFFSCFYKNQLACLFVWNSPSCFLSEAPDGLDLPFASPSAFSSVWEPCKMSGTLFGPPCPTAMSFFWL